MKIYHPPCVTTLWDRGSLSSLGHLTLKAYLDHGHPVDLYVLDEVSNVPEGVSIKDARTVALPPEKWGGKRIRIYSDYWRFCFLADHGGTWIDADCPLVRPLDFLSDAPFFGRETRHWHGGLFGGLIHCPRAGHAAMAGLRNFYFDPDTRGATLQERRSRIGWYAFCNRFYQYAAKEEQSGDPGKFTPLQIPDAVDGATLGTEGRYDGSVRLADYANSYTLHLVGCYFSHWRRQAVRTESLIGDLIKKHIGDVDVVDFLFAGS